MSKIFNPKSMTKLDSPGRRSLIPPETVLDRMDLAPGHTLLDVGAGTGYFALPALKYLGPSGRLIAADLAQEMLVELEKRKPQGTDTLETLLCGADTIPLPHGTADRILLAFVFHEIENQSGYLGEVKRLLKPGGTVTVVEWRKAETPMGPPLDHRIGTEELSRLFVQAGFDPVSTEELNPSNYLAVFSVE